ncbi:hypothetical protein, partial [Acinetobacter baumannii]|uniref:hypothetical protein n=1 Tax=Acinetobacter baumannii TaxID=470 RepID=UPI003D6B73D1
NRGELILTCPVCRVRWDWSPQQDDVLFIDDDLSQIRDPELARALRIYEAFEREWDQARTTANSQASDLWDEWLDGPRPSGSPR